MSTRPPKPRPEGRISHGLRQLLVERPDSDFPLRDLFEHLSGRGHAAIMVAIAVITWIPAVSVVTGPILVFVGLRFSFGQRPWLPRWLLRRTIQRSTVTAMAAKCEMIERRTSRLLRPRLTSVVRNVWMHRALGIAVAVCGVLLPLPIPLTNLPLAMPVLVIGLALIEDDGLYAILGLALAALVLGSLATATWFGGAGLGILWHRIFVRPDAGL